MLMKVSGKVFLTSLVSVAVLCGTAGAVSVYSDQATFLADANAGSTLSLEDFEGYTIQPANTAHLASIDFGDFDVAAGGTGYMGINTGAPEGPPYPSPLIEGDWLHLEGNAPEATYTFTFDYAINAFGIGLVDPVDQVGSSLFWTYNGATPAGGTVAADEANGAQIFFGIVSTDAFTTLTFTLDPVGFDGMAMDNLYFGPSPVPEPASMAMLGLMAVGMAARRRRKQ